MITTKNIWVILPAYNEAKYILSVLERLKTVTESILVVDDGSQDETFSLAKKYTPYVLQHSVNLGKGAALKTGCDYAFRVRDAAAVIVMDADNQHDPQEISAFVSELQKGSDVVLGVRSFSNMPILRTLGNRSASLIMQIFFGLYIPDILSGYKAFTARAYEKIAWQSNGYTVELEIAARMAKNHLPFSRICIRTIYHDMTRGMTVLDLMNVVGHFINWRFFL